MKHLLTIIIVIVFLLIAIVEINAQITETSTFIPPNKIAMRFIDAVEKVNDKVPVGSVVDCPVIYFQQGTEEIFLYCDAVVLDNGFVIELSNFRTSRNMQDANNQMVDLVAGSVSNCDNANPMQRCIVNRIPARENRQYFIHWTKKVKVRGQTKAQTVFSEVKIGANLEKTPLIKVGFVKDKTDQLRFTPQGFSPDQLIDIFKTNPQIIEVYYDFPNTDPADDFGTIVTDINCLDGTKKFPCRDKNGDVNNAVLLTLSTSLPIRPEKYTAVVKIPWQPLRAAAINFPNNEWKIPDREPPAKDFLSSGIEVSLLPNKPERGKAEYSFEGGFTSTVNPTTGKRANVGIFGLTIKPSIGLKSFGVGRTSSGKNGWLALRPLFIADVDTQKVTQSKSPNRIQFGADLEWGTNLGLDFDNDDGANSPLSRNEEDDKKRNPFLRQLIWTNGLRYDSDRDFKLQTMYWRTALGFGLKNLDQSFDQRLFRFRLSQEPGNTRKEPFVSAYYVRPTIGYELGGTIRRDTRAINAPTKNISRGFFQLAMGVEFKRIAKFSIDDTYYYLQNASRRKNRNYLEAMFELNMGRLSRIDLNGFSNSIFLKFQRGDLAPTFAPVNAFSAGFRIYK